VFSEHADFIYSVAVWGDVCLSGGGDGMLLAHDISTAQSVKGSGGLLWGLGASLQGAVRAVGVGGGGGVGAGAKLIAAGDDGNALIYGF
jgi:F-box/WD-40 domain protein 7